jgi:predicted Zn finger-like uncharacterized protein
MFTVCPKCALTLTVTAADLRIAQGFVRCGQCTNVFNALLALSDERQPAASPQESPAHEYPSDAPAAQESVTQDPAHEESAPQARAPEDSQPQEAAPEALADEETAPAEDYSIEQTSLEFNPDAADVAAIFIEPQMIADDEPTGTYESIVLRTQEPAPIEEEEAAPNPDDELNDQLESLAARIDAARQNEITQTHSRLEPLTVPFEVLERQAPRESRPLTWSAAAAALAVLLCVQVINHYRDDLAVNPRLHRPLTALYGLFGLPLAPHWDLAAYEVHQLGAQAAAQNAGELTVRASVRNDAPQPQPLPLLRITLLDRFGNRLASRDVPPRAYLGGAAAAAALLPPGERVDAQMAFVDPGKNAVGFEIDACLPAPSARVHCANDAAAR